ncbi:MAG: cob(I)yrinic acid a,c-diamide adenosyltransferase [Candidatus Peregrinibacteria bacterium]|nr:cob(I)yrinic acid a,c-diamide adenosyltransferase [Candidatus Peregrinibacteria bacterium]
MGIVTKTGDKGTTGLYGGKRVSKGSVRLHAYGSVDELNAILGVILAEEGLSENLRDQLIETQRFLFRVGADLATPEVDNAAKVKRIEAADTERVEKWIAILELTLPPLTRFILPSGSRAGSLLHQARTVCRRAERWVATLGEQEQVNGELLICLNRLSDYLFLAARAANRAAGAEEMEV